MMCYSPRLLLQLLVVIATSSWSSTTTTNEVSAFSSSSLPVVTPAFFSTTTSSSSLRNRYSTRPSKSTSTTRLWGSHYEDDGHNNNDDDDHHRSMWKQNRARTDIRNFLTQRAMQSFLFLLMNVRDSATVRWLEQRYEFKNLDHFHGTGAFNLTKYPEWDDILMDLLQQPPDVVVISAKKRRTGFSKNNPYIQEDQYVEYEIDIDPPSLVSRILSVRDQIAGEWTADLETLMTANEMILDAYNELQNSQREQEQQKQQAEQEEEEKQKQAIAAAAAEEAESVTAEKNSTAIASDANVTATNDTATTNATTVANVTAVSMEEEEAEIDDDVDDDEEEGIFFNDFDDEDVYDEEEDEGEDDVDDEECIKYDEQTSECVDTASLTAPYSDPGVNEEIFEDQSSKKAYDRTTMLVLGNNIVQDGRASSPFRKGSFDLLGLLATQESIHRVLLEYQQSGDERDVSFAWLRDFYVARVSKYFDGSQDYGRADDFLEELLLTPPSMRELENGKVGFIDPMRIAEDIIAMRSEVALDWKDVMAKVTSKDHADLRRLVLSIQMGKKLEDQLEQLPEFSKEIFEEGFQ